MTVICAVCGADFNIETGKCSKCESDRKLITVREDIRIEDRMEWICRVMDDPDLRERFGLRIERMAETENDEGRLTRDTHIIDTVHGILTHVLETKNGAKEWGISRIREERIDQK